MEEIMQSNAFFIVPLTLAYGAICALWFLLHSRGVAWQILPIDRSPKPWMDFGIALGASVLILAIGQLYSGGYLLPKANSPAFNSLVIWPLNNVIIFSPIFLTLLIRKQGLETIFLSKHQIGKKLLFGAIASVIGVLLFIGFRGEWHRTFEIASHIFTIDAISNFPATFFENVAVAFLFVRLNWAVGKWWSIGTVAFLFAFAHVPASIAEGDPLSHILTFFVLTGSLTVMILYTAYRGRDIIWLGIVHYVMDVVIGVF